MQVIADQTMFAPVMIAFFFTATSFMEGKSAHDVQRKLENVRLFMR